ncbi:TPA: hypothetical protein ACHIEL_002101 [Enterococcus faecium]
MNKIIPLLFVLFGGEILMRHGAAVHLNFVLTSTTGYLQINIL